MRRAGGIPFLGILKLRYMLGELSGRYWRWPEQCSGGAKQDLINILAQST